MLQNMVSKYQFSLAAFNSVLLTLLISLHFLHCVSGWIMKISIVTVNIESFLSLGQKTPSSGFTTLVLIYNPRRMVRMALALYGTISTVMAVLHSGSEYSCLQKEHDALSVLLQQLKEQTWSHLPSLHTRLGVGCNVGSKICRLWCLFSVLSLLTPPPSQK